VRRKKFWWEVKKRKNLKIQAVVIRVKLNRSFALEEKMLD
jgi:hypothetical protein